MDMKNHTRLDLVEGGSIFKQGEHAQLAFNPRDYSGKTVDLTGKDIAVAIWNSKGIMYEGTASFDSTAQLIRLTINQLLQHGDFQIEFTVTDAADPDYRRKFPSGEYEGKIYIKPSADNIDFIGVSMTTVAQLRTEQEEKQQQFELAIVPQVDELKQRVEEGIGAFTEDTEVLDARMGETNLRQFNEKTIALLAETEQNLIDVSVSINKFPKIAPEADDAARIQRAINSNAKTILIPLGTYYVGANLKPKANQTVVVEGELHATLQTMTILEVAADNVTVRGSGRLVGLGKTLGNSSGLVTSRSNTVVENITVTGFSNAGIGGGSGSVRPKIRNVIAYENKTGISMYRTLIPMIMNCEAYNNGVGVNGGGIVLMGIAGSQVEDFLIANNNCRGNYAMGIGAYNVTKGAITGNVCNDNGGGNLGQGSGIVLLLEPAGTTVSDVAITNNTACRNSDHGIVVQINKDHTSFITGVTISNNTCRSNYKCGIRLINGIDLSTITGNTCNSNGTAPSAAGYRHGIMIADRCSRSIFSSNTCLSNGEDGICITDLSVDFSDAGSVENTVSSNNCRTNGRYGISIKRNTVQSSNNRVMGNYCRGNASGEILDEGLNNDFSNNKYTTDRVQGAGALVAGTATFSTTEVRSGDRIIVSVITPGGSQGALYVSNINNGMNFTVKSTSATDTSTIAWKIDH